MPGGRTWVTARSVSCWAVASAATARKAKVRILVGQLVRDTAESGQVAPTRTRPAARGSDGRREASAGAGVGVCGGVPH
jgi:hypothetical protein